MNLIKSRWGIVAEGIIIYSRLHGPLKILKVNLNNIFALTCSDSIGKIHKYTLNGEYYNFSGGISLLSNTPWKYENNKI